MLSKKIIEKATQAHIMFVTLTQYEADMDCAVAFPPITIAHTLAEEIARAGIRQVHIAETEKYAHVTYFFNGGKEITYNLEEHILVHSRKDVPTHDLAPKMRAHEITDKVIAEMEDDIGFILVNYANPDMVGHTANVPAIIEAVEEVDFELGRISTELHKKNYTVIIIADHGNAELNVDQETGIKHTAHTTNPVPCIITDKQITIRDGGLSDVAPTILGFMGLEKPADMTGTSLVE
jgi:2,3-bisphosphoglycerate-independent phosphoglycerate mutase